MNTNNILLENQRRTALYFRDYDRITGDPQGEVVPRVPVAYNRAALYLPTQTLQHHVKYGWHTNKRTKYLAYDRSRAAIRDGEYIERDRRCADEMAWLETKTDGSLGAIEGQHDDIIDTTAIAIYISSEEMPTPKHINAPGPAARRHTRKGGEAVL